MALPCTPPRPLMVSHNASCRSSPLSIDLEWHMKSTGGLLSGMITCSRRPESQCLFLGIGRARLRLSSVMPCPPMTIEIEHSCTRLSLICTALTLPPCPFTTASQNTLLTLPSRLSFPSLSLSSKSLIQLITLVIPFDSLRRLVHAQQDTHFQTLNTNRHTFVAFCSNNAP